MTWMIWMGIYPDNATQREACDSLTACLGKRREVDKSCWGLHWTYESFAHGDAIED